MFLICPEPNHYDDWRENVKFAHALKDAKSWAETLGKQYTQVCVYQQKLTQVQTKPPTFALYETNEQGEVFPCT